MNYIRRIYLITIRILNYFGEDKEYKFFSDTNNIDKIEKHLQSELNINTPIMICDICIRYEGSYADSIEKAEKINDLSIYDNFEKNLEYAKKHYLNDLSDIV